MASLLSAACALAAPSEEANRPSFTAKLPEYHDVVSVLVYIDGASHLCVIDSGASHHVFDSRLRAVLGEPLGRGNGDSADGKRFNIEYFSLPIATLGTLELKSDLPVGCFDLMPAREATGRNVEGVLGLPLFQTNIVQFDFDSQQFNLFDASAQPRADWGEPIGVSYTKTGLPVVMVKLGNQPDEPCVVDTGHNRSLSLATSVFSELAKTQAVKLGEDTDIATAIGASRVRTGTLTSLKIGQFENKELYVGESNGNSRIGLEYLRRFRITFDIRHNRIYLTKSSEFDRPDKKPSLGMSVLRKNGKTIVTYVWKNSATEKAGILSNDELTSVTDVPITTQPIAEVMWLIREKGASGKAVILGIKRDGKERSVTLNVRE